MPDGPYRLGYAVRDVPRGSTRVAWWMLIGVAAVPVAFVGVVHLAFFGECIRLGREPTPADPAAWALPLMMLSVPLFYLHAPCAVASAPLALGMMSLERGRWRRIAVAAALGALGPAMLVIVWGDPLRAFYWWVD